MEKILEAFVDIEAERLDEGWRQMATAALMGAASMAPMASAAKNGKLPPAFTQNVSQSDFVNYIKRNENSVNAGLENGKWHVYMVNKVPHIGYGHKLKPGELNTFRSGLSDDEVNKLFMADMAKAKTKAATDFKAMTGRELKELPPIAQMMFIDFVFNLGTIESYPKFVDAIASGNIAVAGNEYIRKMKKDGQLVPLEMRNEEFKSLLLDPWIVSMRSGFRPIAGKPYTPVAKPITKKIKPPVSK